MEIIYNWEITTMEVILNKDGLSNVVNSIDWRLIATVDGEKYYSEKWDKLYLSSPEESSFIAYDELSKEQVVGWIESLLDVEELKNELAIQIDSQINPTLVILPPPFAN